MTEKRRSVLLFILAIALLASPSMAEAKVEILGQLTGTGKEMVKAGERNWSTVQEGFVHPVLVNSAFRTDGGNLMIDLKDGTRLELKNETEARLTGSHGNYTIELMKGSLDFDVPDSSLLTIRTHNYSIAAGKNITGETTSTAGGVFYGDTNTQVASNTGSVKVQSLETGKAVGVVDPGEKMSFQSQRPDKDMDKQMPVKKLGDQPKKSQWWVLALDVLAVAIFIPVLF